MRVAATLAFGALLACLSGCFDDEPDKLEPPTPTLSSHPTIGNVTPSAPPHDIGLVQLEAGENAAYVAFSTKGYDDGIRGRFRASTLNGGDAFYFVAIDEAGQVVWADLAAQHQFFHGADRDNLTLRFYAKSDAKVYVTINDTYIDNQGDLEVRRETTTYESVPLVATEFTVQVEGSTVAAELTDGVGEYILSDPDGTERASWPTTPYTLTALRGEWELRAGMASLGSVDVTLVRLPAKA